MAVTSLEMKHEQTTLKNQESLLTQATQDSHTVCTCVCVGGELKKSSPFKMTNQFTNPKNQQYKHPALDFKSRSEGSQNETFKTVSGLEKLFRLNVMVHTFNPITREQKQVDLLVLGYIAENEIYFFLCKNFFKLHCCECECVDVHVPQCGGQRTAFLILSFHLSMGSGDGIQAISLAWQVVLPTEPFCQP